MANLEDLYFGQIKDLYDAEQRLVDALPKMINAASATELQEGLTNHLRETETHVQRLETIFSNHNKKPEAETCKAMRGLLAEGESEMKEWKGTPEVKDAAIIASAQRVEHYEMSGYGTAKCFAEMLGFAEDIPLLEKTLNEERKADEKLTDIAISCVNRDALLSAGDKSSSRGQAHA